ncbi:glycosyltransferase [Mycolicibacterium palauense]|uniref:glycosyltransferase n=1 Tax=Mycolicibacterium palauense TaxID=2034511 RepID=UPI000BFEECD3|nr:glycosyltransferase [Mycolicibacterium palauense]
MSVTDQINPVTPGPDGLRVSLVTAYPPSRTTLNEYGYHLARHLAAKPEVRELIILHDDLEEGAEESLVDLPDGARAVPAWRYGSLWNPVRIARAVRACKPDVVLVNAHFTSFGSGKAAAALGLMVPALLRAGGTPTVVLLHNLVDTVDLQEAGYSSNRVLTWVLSFLGGLVTRMVLAANKVCVTMPQYVDVLSDRYGARNVYLAPHGSFEQPDPVVREPAGMPSLLAFGKWGTYKRLEVLLDAHAILRSQGVDVEVVVAGTDSHNAVGYLEGIEEKYRGVPGISFTGYVAEEDVPGVFGAADVAVFPYTSTTGSSGVLHQAGSYGCPVVLPAIDDLAECVREEGFKAVTFDAGDPGDLARALRAMLADPVGMAAMGEANRAAACGIPLADIADWHLVHLQEICGRG